MTKRFYFLAVASTLIVGCGGSGTSVKSPNEVFSVANNAIDSMAVEGLTYAKMNPHAFSVTLDPNCDEHGAPLDSPGGDQLSSSDPTYASKFFYCLAKQPSGGEDTLQGAISLPRSLACALDGKLHFNGQPETTTITIDSTCFEDSFIEENGGEVEATGTVTTSKVGEPLFGDASEWDYSVEIVAENVGDSESVDVKLLFKTSETLFAAAMSANVNGHTNDASAVFIDTANGILRYESKNQRYAETCDGGSCGWNRHNRLLVEGDIQSDGTFTTVNNIEGAHSDMYKQDPSDFSTMITIKGNTTDGLFTQNLQMAGDPTDVSDFSGLITNCSSGDCTGNTGIDIADSSDLEFLMSPTSPSLTAGADWFDAMAPLSFTSVTTADSQ